MTDYDFSTLNDKEFENLAMDLISRDRGKRFERFKVGKDGGVDGRFYSEDNTEEIVQCKHYLKTGYKGLISSLRKKDGNEKDKVIKLNPERYIFVTSLPLGRKEKEEFKEIFKPYIKSDSDIYGQEDLNDLLKANPDIEESHYKLWISSTTVLKRIFNNAIKGRSEFLLDEIKEKIKYYVITENHNKAIKKLEESHTIIIAGEPGIGKTTLAEQISLNYIEKGFEFCIIAKDISEAEAIFERDKKQIFYFDDFLGSNYLNALEAHTDSHIMQFITRVKKDKDKRFILTSRTNIFNQSILVSDKFRTKKLDSDEFIITVDELTEINKAKILYNHLWHSNLSEEYIDELYKDKRYKEIIKHKNFNPRLIEFITDIDRIRSNSATSYWQDIQNNLDNPREIWVNTFDRQSDEYIRNIVSLVVFNGNSIEEEELKEAYYRLNNLMGLQNSSHSSKEFDSVIEETIKYFLNRRILRDNEVEYSLFNPSIADFILDKYSNNEEKIFNIFLSLKTVESLKKLYSLKYNFKLYNNICIKLYNQVRFNINDNIRYIIKLIYMQEQENKTCDKTRKIIQNLIENPRINIYHPETMFIVVLDDLYYELLDIITHFNLDVLYFKHYKLIEIIIKILQRTSKDFLSVPINKLIEVLEIFKIDNDEIIFDLENLIEEFIRNELEQKIENLFNDFDLFYSIDGNIYIKDGDIEKIINSYFNDIYNNFDINHLNQNFINKEKIINELINIEDKKNELISEYYDSLYGSKNNNYIKNNDNNIDNIDELFDRS